MELVWDCPGAPLRRPRRIPGLSLTVLMLRSHGDKTRMLYLVAAFPPEQLHFPVGASCFGSRLGLDAEPAARMLSMAG